MIRKATWVFWGIFLSWHLIINSAGVKELILIREDKKKKICKRPLWPFDWSFLSYDVDQNAP